MADVKRVYTFGNKEAEGNGKMRELLGGKGANLAEMNLIGIPVPPGFTITTEVCSEYYAQGREKVVELLRPEVEKAMKNIEKLTGMKFGDKEMPLLVSVRSGARASMPGMMDTILNLGMNDQAVEAVAKRTGNPRFAWDSYRRFVQMYGDVVLGMKPASKEEHDPFEELIDAQKEKRGVKNDTDLTTDDLKELAGQFKAEYKSKIGSDFPTDPKEQLMGAIKAVFRSWDNPRANVYRRDNDIPYSWGTAVNVQSMAFGNMGDDCGTGVAFTRNPATGEKKLMGEFLTNAQGEDVVAGVHDRYCSVVCVRTVSMPATAAAVSAVLCCCPYASTFVASLMARYSALSSRASSSLLGRYGRYLAANTWSLSSGSVYSTIESLLSAQSTMPMGGLSPSFMSSRV